MLGRSLLKDFPNPERVGCPGTDVLKRIASHRMPLSEADKWLDHLGSCSPCYGDFKRLRQAHESRRNRMVPAVAAGILLAVTLTGWAVLHKRNENLMTQTPVLDLRDRSIARGAEANPAEPPLEISRRVPHLKIYLPVGSSEGHYDVRIMASAQKIIFVAKGTAVNHQGITIIPVEMNLSSASPGPYILQIRKFDSGWASYSLRLK